MAQECRYLRGSGRIGGGQGTDHLGVSSCLSHVETIKADFPSGLVTEKASEDLFTVDTNGSNEIRTEHVRRMRKPLKADQILAQRSAVPALNSHKRPADSPITDGIVAPRAKRIKGPFVADKEYTTLRKIAYGGDTTQKDVVTVQGASYDPWAVQEPAAQPQFSFIPPEVVAKEPKTLKRTTVSLLKNGKHLPAVSKPHAGRSYNPKFEDWDRLIAAEGDKEVIAELQRLKEEKEDQERQEMFERAAREEEEEEARLAESSAWETDAESEWEGIMSGAEEARMLNKKRPVRKTQAERNKIKRRKEEERLRLHEEKQKKRDKQVAHAKMFAKELSARDKLRKAQMNAKQPSAFDSSEDDEEAEIELRRRKFGKVPLPQGPLEVVLADELQDSLRLLKPEGNLLNDRFRSMMLRGKIETRKQITQWKKPRRETTEKWSYKDWKLM